MFIELSMKEGKSPVYINISNICSVNGDVIKLNNSDIIQLDKESVEKLMSVIAPDERESLFMGEPIQHRPSELGDFLTKLHNLLGGRGEAKLTTDRKARLATRMKDFSKEELILAATNLGSDEFMQGGNDNGKRYGTIDYLLRTSANVNKWLEEQPEKKKSLF